MKFCPCSLFWPSPPTTTQSTFVMDVSHHHHAKHSLDRSISPPPRKARFWWMYFTTITQSIVWRPRFQSPPPRGLDIFLATSGFWYMYKPHILLTNQHGMKVYLYDDIWRWTNWVYIIGLGFVWMRLPVDVSGRNRWFGIYSDRTHCCHAMNWDRHHPDNSRNFMSWVVIFIPIRKQFSNREPASTFQGCNLPSFFSSCNRCILRGQNW